MLESETLFVCDLLIVTFWPFLPVLNLLLPIKLHVIRILSLCISAHLTVLPLLNPVLNLTFSLPRVTSSHTPSPRFDLQLLALYTVNI